MRLFQRDAHISIDFLNRTFTKTAINRSGHLAPVDTFDESAADADSLYREIDSFIDCVRHGKTPLVSGEDGRRALETALRIRESLQDWADDSEFLATDVLATGKRRGLGPSKAARELMRGKPAWRLHRHKNGGALRGKPARR